MRTLLRCKSSHEGSALRDGTFQGIPLGPVSSRIIVSGLTIVSQLLQIDGQWKDERDGQADQSNHAA